MCIASKLSYNDALSLFKKVNEKVLTKNNLPWLRYAATEANSNPLQKRLT